MMFRHSGHATQYIHALVYNTLTGILRAHAELKFLRANDTIVQSRTCNNNDSDNIIIR